MKPIPLLASLVLALPTLASAQTTSILVYDNNTQHNFAQTAALNISPGGTTVGNAMTFNGLLTGGTWDVVAVDCPSTAPSGGWTDLVNYVSGGGRAVVSFWDWDVSTPAVGDPALTAAFDVVVTMDISLSGMTLQDSGAGNVFNGVTMPNGDWHNHWGDDGDEFAPQAGAIGLAHLGNPLAPCMVMGNGGNTIAAQVIDDAGDTWLGDGSGVTLWENLINAIAGGPGGSAAAIQYGCGVNPPTSVIIGCCPPTPGASVLLGLDNPAGTQAAGTIPFLVFAFAPDPNFPCGTQIPGFGMAAPGAPGELLIDLAPPTPIAPILVGPPLVLGLPSAIQFLVPNDPLLLGTSVFAQGLLLDPSAPPGGVKFGLTDAVELQIGT